jgi:hypothetical protein
MLSIPPAESILQRAADLRYDARQQRDASAIKASAAIIASVVCDYDTLAWDGQYLTVASESHPGATHQVSAFGCSCPAKKPCWHMRLRELLIGLFETEAESADIQADADELPAARPIGQRIAAARRNYAYAV